MSTDSDFAFQPFGSRPTCAFAHNSQLNFREARRKQVAQCLSQPQRANGDPLHAAPSPRSKLLLARPCCPRSKLSLTRPCARPALNFSRRWDARPEKKRAGRRGPRSQVQPQRLHSGCDWRDVSCPRPHSQSIPIVGPLKQIVI